MNPDHLVPLELVYRVGQEVRSYSLAEAEELIDEIYKRQPVALTHLIVLSKQGVTYPLLDHAFHLLMVVYASFKAAQVEVRTITEDMIEQAWDNNFAMTKFFEKEESEAERERLHRLSLAGYPEPYLMTYFVMYLKEEVMKGKPSIEGEWIGRASISLLDCFVRASR
jgi:hypothetical protein